jgi:hypothetical protein
MMNSLTVNLHLLMVSFWRPEGRRTKVLMERGAFPSDTYAVKTHVRARGLDPAREVIEVGPRAGEALIREDDLLDAIREAGESLALVMVGGVNYATGQAFDIARITAAAHAVGALAGWDLAHWAGNLPARLHEWDVDFACWCSYKYLNAGPGAVAGAFVHERHGRRTDLPRFAGWWGNDPATRFAMGPEFAARVGADGWQWDGCAAREEPRRDGVPAVADRGVGPGGLPRGDAGCARSARRAAEHRVRAGCARAARGARPARHRVRLPRAEHRAPRARAAVQRLAGRARSGSRALRPLNCVRGNPALFYADRASGIGGGATWVSSLESR